MGLWTLLYLSSFFFKVATDRVDAHAISTGASPSALAEPGVREIAAARATVESQHTSPSLQFHSSSKTDVHSIAYKNTSSVLQKSQQPHSQFPHIISESQFLQQFDRRPSKPPHHVPEKTLVATPAPSVVFSSNAAILERVAGASATLDFFTDSFLNNFIAQSTPAPPILAPKSTVLDSSIVQIGDKVKRSIEPSRLSIIAKDSYQWSPPRENNTSSDLANSSLNVISSTLDPHADAVLTEELYHSSQKKEKTEKESNTILYVEDLLPKNGTSPSADLLEEPSSAYIPYKIVAETYFPNKLCALPVLLLWSIFLFFLGSRISESYFTPAMVRLAAILNFSDSLAGCTLLAFANGSGDLLSGIITAVYQPEAIQFFVGNVFGSTLCLTTVVFGFALYASRHPVVKLDRTFMQRDIPFCLTGLLVFIFFALKSGEIPSWGPLVLFPLYILYIVFAVKQSASSLVAMESLLEDIESFGPSAGPDTAANTSSSALLASEKTALINGADDSNVPQATTRSVCNTQLRHFSC